MRWRALVALLACGPALAGGPVRVGSKKFTESVVLGEIVKELLASEGVPAEHRSELGGTQILWKGLLASEIDVYPEYTGTIAEEILAGSGVKDVTQMRALLHGKGVLMMAPLGFDDTYALGMKEELAQKLGIRTISDLAAHPDLAFGFSNEFMDRKDGWPGLRERYGLSQSDVRGLDHDLAYRGIDSGAIALTDLYSTDAEIAFYHLRVLQDDKGYFPSYQAVLLVREAAGDARLEGILSKLEGRIPADAMVKMNARAKLDKVPEAQVAADFLAETFGVRASVTRETVASRLARNTLAHLRMVGISLALAIPIAIPLGIFAARRPRLGQIVLGAVGVLQTVPSLALLVVLIPLLGLGGPPAIVALFLYSLLPIVRNTHAGLHDIAPSLIESADALGLPPGARLWLVELPLASRSILAGIKTSAVINVGTATLGAIIGAGGYGEPILTGIRLAHNGLILEGAVPAALLALLVQGMFDVLDRAVVPAGLRRTR